MFILNLLTSQTASVEEIFQSLKKVDVDISSGTLYPILANLQNRNLVCKELEQLDSGKFCRCFGITEKGSSKIKSLKKDLHHLNKILQQPRRP